MRVNLPVTNLLGDCVGLAMVGTAPGGRVADGALRASFRMRNGPSRCGAALAGTVAGILLSPLFLDAGWGALVVLGVVCVLALWVPGRLVLHVPTPLKRALLASMVFAGLAFCSVRPTAPVPAGEGLCVGEILEGVLQGRCRSLGPWQVTRVTVRPYLHLPQRLVSVQGVLDPGGPPRGPGLVDRGALARLNRVGGTLSSHQSPSLVGFLGARPSAIRDGLRRRHARLFQGLDRYGVIAAMTTGNRRRMARETQNAFRDAGLAHLLAISGFHVGVIGWGLYVLVGGICTRCGLGPRGSVILRGCITIVIVSLFAFAAGGSPSTVRAAVMASIILGRRGLGRRGLIGMHALGLTALAFLVLRPEGMLSAGFAMSVLAVYGLLADVRGSHRLIVVTLCAILFTSPIAAGLFGQLVPVSLLSNLVAGPLTALVLYAALFAHLAPLTAIATAASTAADILAQALVWWAGAFSHSPSIPVDGFRAVLLVPVLLIGRLPRTAAGRLSITTGLVFVTVLAPAFVSPRRPLDVTFLDVGQGDAILVESPGGQVLLIDTGPPGADWTIRAALQERKVDMALITHPHRDHDGGLAALVRDNILNRDSLETPKAGDMIDLDTELRLLVLAPPQSSQPGSPNDDSVVLLIRHGDITFLLFGDAERRTEQFLVETWSSLLKANVVKVAHHGSKTSSHRFLVSRLADPEDTGFAIISVAAENRFGLPDESVIHTWVESGYSVMSTAETGSIRCSSTGRTVTCSPFAQLSR